MADEYVRVSSQALAKFVASVFKSLSVPTADAETAAEVLVRADLRGIDSHGVARLGRYVNGLRKGLMNPNPRLQIVRETPSTALVDGDAGLGQVVGKWAMQVCLDKAQAVGSAAVVVRNSNHFGIAGYYAMMALPRNMIGVALTSSRPLAVPTFGRDAIIGTNPIALAAPALEEPDFVLDMATTTVAIGKVEAYARKGKSLPLGWAVDRNGNPTTDPEAVLNGGALLPLGGTAENSGYKGYGLSAMVDVLCGVLSGAQYARLVDSPSPSGQPRPSNLGHYFAALRIDAFQPAEEFKRYMDQFLRDLKQSAKAEGQERIYTAGEIEMEKEREYSQHGVPLHVKVVQSLSQIGKEQGIDFAAVLSATQ